MSYERKKNKKERKKEEKKINKMRNLSLCTVLWDGLRCCEVSKNIFKERPL